MVSMSDGVHTDEMNEFRNEKNMAALQRKSERNQDLAVKVIFG